MDNKELFTKEYAELCRKYQLEIVMEHDYGDDQLVLIPYIFKEGVFPSGISKIIEDTAIFVELSLEKRKKDES